MDPSSKTEQSDEIWKASIQTDDSSSDDGHSSDTQDDGVAETTLPGIKGIEDVASSLFELEPDDGEVAVESEDDEFNVKRIRHAIEEAVRRYGSAVLADLEAFQRNQRNLKLANRERKKQLWMRYHSLHHLQDGVDINEYFSSLDREERKSLVVKSHSLFAGAFPGCLESLETSREYVEEQSTEYEVDSKSLNVESDVSSDSEYSDTLCVTLDAEDDETSTSKDEENQHRNTRRPDSSAEASSFDSHVSSHFSRNLLALSKEDHVNDHDTEQGMEEAHTSSTTEGDESFTVAELTTVHDEVDTSYAATKTFDEDHMVPLTPGRHFKIAEKFVYETGLDLHTPSLSPFPDKQRDAEISDSTMLPLELSTKFTEEGIFSDEDEPVPVATITGATNRNVATSFSTSQVHGDLPQLDLSLYGDGDEKHNSVDVGSTNAAATTTKQTEEQFDTENVLDAENFERLEDDDDDLAEMESLKMNAMHSINILLTNKSWLGSFSKRMPQDEQSVGEANERAQGSGRQEAELAGGNDDNLTKKETLGVDAKHVSEYGSTTRSLDPIIRRNGTWLGSFNNRLIQVEPLVESEEGLVAKRCHPDEEFENISDIENTTNSYDNDEEITDESLSSEPINLTNGTWHGSFNKFILQVESKEEFVGKGHELDEDSSIEDETSSSNNDEIQHEGTTCLLSVKQVDPPVTEEDEFSAPFSNNNLISRGSVSNNTINMVDPSKEDGNISPVAISGSDEGISSVSVCTYPPIRADSDAEDQVGEENSGQLNDQVDTTATTSVDGTVNPQLPPLNDAANNAVKGNEELESSDEHVRNFEPVGTAKKSSTVDDEVKLSAALSKSPIDSDDSASDIHITLSVRGTPKCFSDYEDDQVQERVRESDSEQLATWINDKPNETIKVEDSILDDPMETAADGSAEFSMETVADPNERSMAVPNNSMVDVPSDETIILVPILSEERSEPIMKVTEISQDIVERFNTASKKEVFPMETVADPNERSMAVPNNSMVDVPNDETILLVPILSEERPEPTMKVTEISQDIVERFNTASKKEVSDSNEKQFILKPNADNRHTAAASSGITAEHKSALQNLVVLAEEASKQPVPESTVETGNAKARITKQYTQQIFKDLSPPDVVSLASTDSEDGTSSSDEEEGEDKYKNIKFRGFVVVLHERHGVMLLLSSRDDPSQQWQLPGGQIHQCEFIEAARYSSDKKTQLALAAKACAARELYDQTGLDFRYKLGRLVVPPDKEQTKNHMKELKRRFFFILRLKDNELLRQGSHPVGDWGNNLMVKLSAKHSDFTFEPEPSIAANMVKLQSASKCSEAILMAMDPSKLDKDLGDTCTQTETTKSDLNDSGMMAEMLDFLAKTCFCFR